MSERTHASRVAIYRVETRRRRVHAGYATFIVR